MLHEAFYYISYVWQLIRSWLDGMRIANTPFTLWHLAISALIFSIFLIVMRVFFGGKH